MNASDSVLEMIEENIREFIGLARELVRKRSDRFMMIKVKYPEELGIRIELIKEFRKNHSDMRNSINKLVNGLNADNSSFIKDIEYAYDAVKEIDSLNLSSEGARIWKMAEQTYRSRSVIVENNIIQLLKATLNTAHSSNEMFSMFEKFGFLSII
ncbi:unnamed protein product [Ambrosiozyma monospora]|uniref:Unnamed protein product n=1 Tax=Ambrosiozyma monospora TaxID=43982 RepID=A0ACB5U929_AMBMO|nr:unnamed protein product [Ambrosiozyma monospora]